jgi:sugar/nucleoside kinase (ribokinase family)
MEITKKHGKIGLVTLAERGSMIIDGETIIDIPVITTEKVIDATGC